MAKKTLKKYQTPGTVGQPRRTKLSIVSPTGDYRTTTKTKNTPNSYSESSKTKRTLQGVLKGVPKVNMSNPPVNEELPPPSGSFMKRGGVKKTITIKKKK